MTKTEAQNQIIEMQRDLLTGEVAPGILPNIPFCVFKGPNNERCAIGMVLFKTNTYRDDFEEEGIKALWRKWLHALPEVMRVAGETFCTDIQMAHDRIVKDCYLPYFRYKYYNVLEEFCKKNSLIFPFTPDILETK